ncbi:STAS-like domain-containing protein [Candidatus Omnitrophota bacterium]
MRNIKDLILKQIRSKGSINSDAIAKICNISRQAAHQHLRELVKSRNLLKIGKTRGSYYILFSKEEARKLKKEDKVYKVRLRNKKIQEDFVYNRVIYRMPSLKKLQKNTQDIIRYAFTEMLNNAIEHSSSEYIDILLTLTSDTASFNVTDKGIGIFKHIQKKFKLADEYDALTEILKGKRTTMPSKHTGEGIFFTSKTADVFKIESAKIGLIIDNKVKDIYTNEIKYRKGTKVYFQVNKNTRKDISTIFAQYTDSDYKFNKTKVIVKLYHKNVEYTSRSQARRLITGLNKFKVVILDFNQVKTIGQGFADEIFRVFLLSNPGVAIEPTNCSRAVDFMIKRVRSK